MPITRRSPALSSAGAVQSSYLDVASLFIGVAFLVLRGGLLAYAFANRRKLTKPMRHPWWALVLAPSSFWIGVVLIGDYLGRPFLVAALIATVGAWTTFYIQAMVAYGPRTIFRLRHLGDPAWWRGELQEPVPRRSARSR